MKFSNEGESLLQQKTLQFKLEEYKSLFVFLNKTPTKDIKRLSFYKKSDIKGICLSSK